VRLFEAREKDNCKIVASVFSTDPSRLRCVLLLRQLVLLRSRCRRKGEGCFSSNVSKVLFVKCEDYVRVSLSFMALSVFVTPPVLNECGPFGTLPC
jgi:hypothetical protein